METSKAEIPGAFRNPGIDRIWQLIAAIASGESRSRTCFVDDILSRLETGIKLDDQEIGTWYATAEAADWCGDPRSDRVGVRFLLSRHPIETQRIEASSSLQKPQKYDSDLKQSEMDAANLAVIFNFTNIVPVTQNIDLFREFAVSQIKRLRAK